MRQLGRVDCLSDNGRQDNRCRDLNRSDNHGSRDHNDSRRDDNQHGPGDDDHRARADNDDHPCTGHRSQLPDHATRRGDRPR